MAVQTSLDYRNLDSTWEMIALTRLMFNPGVLEGTGLLSLITGDTEINVSGYTLINKDGVIVWEDSNTVIPVPGVDGTYYIKVNVVRTETTGISGVTISASSTPPSISAGDISFGVCTVSGGTPVLSNTSRTSISVVNNYPGGRFRGYFPIGNLPALDDQDLLDGDTFIVKDSGNSDLYMYVFNSATGAYHITSMYSQIQQTIELNNGNASNRVLLDAQNGEIRVGNSVILNSAGLGSIQSGNIEGTNVIGSVVKAGALQNNTGTVMRFGTGSNDKVFAPNANGYHSIGSASLRWKEAYINTIKAVAGIFSGNVQAVSGIFSGNITTVGQVNPSGDINCGGSINALSGSITAQGLASSGSITAGSDLISIADVLSGGIVRATTDLYEKGRTTQVGHWSSVTMGLEGSITDGIAIRPRDGSTDRTSDCTLISSLFRYSVVGKTVTVSLIVSLQVDTNQINNFRLIPSGIFAGLAPVDFNQDTGFLYEGTDGVICDATPITTGPPNEFDIRSLDGTHIWNSVMTLLLKGTFQYEIA